MTRIRIRCRVPVEQAKPDENGFPILPRIAVNGRSPDWQDLEVFAVAPDGAETPLTNVDRVEFVAQASPEPLRVAVTFLNPEIDVEGVDDNGAAHERLVEFIARQFFDDSGEYRGTAAEARRGVRASLDELGIVVAARREPSASPPVARLRRDGVWSDLPVGHAGDVWDVSRGAWVAPPSPEPAKPAPLPWSSNEIGRFLRGDPPAVPPPQPGTWAEAVSAVPAAVCDACPNVTGVDFSMPSAGVVSLKLHGDGVSAEERDRAIAVAIELLPAGVSVGAWRARL